MSRAGTATTSPYLFHLYFLFFCSLSPPQLLAIQFLSYPTCPPWLHFTQSYTCFTTAFRLSHKPIPSPLHTHPYYSNPLTHLSYNSSACLYVVKTPNMKKISSFRQCVEFLLITFCTYLSLNLFVAVISDYTFQECLRSTVNIYGLVCLYWIPAVFRMADIETHNNNLKPAANA